MSSGKVLHVSSCEEGENGTFNSEDGPDYKAYWEAIENGDVIERREFITVRTYFA